MRARQLSEVSITLVIFPTPLSLVYFTLFFLHIVFLLNLYCNRCIYSTAQLFSQIHNTYFGQQFSFLIKIHQASPYLFLLLLCRLFILFFFTSGTTCQTWLDPPMWPLGLTSKTFPRWKSTNSHLLPLKTHWTLISVTTDHNDHHSFQVSDKDFSITINAYFNVKWRDPRLLVSKDYSKEGRQPEVMLLLNVLPQSSESKISAWKYPSMQ